MNPTLTTKISAVIPHPIYVEAKTYCAANKVDLKDVVAEALRFYLSNINTPKPAHT
jgi:hypothetical protein